ncbi:hypothetical protein D3C87_2081100 [compost metagenome]
MLENQIRVEIELGSQLVAGLFAAGADPHRLDVRVALIDGDKLLPETHTHDNYCDLLVAHCYFV